MKTFLAVIAYSTITLNALTVTDAHARAKIAQEARTILNCTYSVIRTEPPSNISYTSEGNIFLKVDDGDVRILHRTGDWRSISSSGNVVVEIDAERVRVSGPIDDLLVPTFGHYGAGRTTLFLSGEGRARLSISRINGDFQASGDRQPNGSIAVSGRCVRSDDPLSARVF